MLRNLYAACYAAMLYRGYEPKKLSLRAILSWLSQFDRKDHKPLRMLLRKVSFLSEKDISRSLIELNDKLLERMAKSRIPAKKMIYVQIHDAGSSSPFILNILRDKARLQQRGCHFLDSRDIEGLVGLTNQLEEGAIVYVDDFSASGNQFTNSRDYFAQYIFGNFAEFFLLPCICEEAIEQLERRGVDYLAGHVHYKKDRPLHENSELFPSEVKSRLIELSFHIDPRGGLGYRRMATMIVLYRNAPTTTPTLLRGNPGQNPFRGVFPRSTDLPL
jgi:hypothetical protein